MDNQRLRRVRKQRLWSQAFAAEKAQVSERTYMRWELGTQMPRGYNLALLCKAFGVSPQDLGYTDDGRWLDEAEGHIASKKILVQMPAQVLLREQRSSIREERETLSQESDEQKLPYKELEALYTDLEIRVQCMIYEALSRQTSLHDLRRKLTSELALEGSVAMDLERRKLLRHMALIPIQAFGLSMVGASRPFAPEDVLIHCTSGITACEHLAKGIDLNLAYTATSTYIPTLKSVIKDYPPQRRDAAELTAQALLLLATLGLHLEGSKAAISYAQQAVSYSETSGNLELTLTALGQLAWLLSCDKQYHKALEKAQLAEHLLKNAKDVHPLVQSNTYAVLGAYSAQNGYREEALTALNMATQSFFSTTPAGAFSYMDYDYSEIALTWGLAHSRTGHPEEALKSFTEIIDPTTLATKMQVSERVRVEFLNNMTLTSVKSSTKDMEQAVRYWQAGIQGAKVLQSEQRFSEAVTAYEIMESIWTGDKRIINLREQIVHW